PNRANARAKSTILPANMRYRLMSEHSCRDLIRIADRRKVRDWRRSGSQLGLSARVAPMARRVLMARDDMTSPIAIHGCHRQSAIQTFPMSDRTRDRRARSRRAQSARSSPLSTGTRFYGADQSCSLRFAGSRQKEYPEVDRCAWTMPAKLGRSERAELSQ